MGGGWSERAQGGESAPLSQDAVAGSRVLVQPPRSLKVPLWSFLWGQDEPSQTLALLLQTR